MNAWTYLAIHDGVGLASAAYLITHGHPGFSWLFLALVATTTIKTSYSERS